MNVIIVANGSITGLGQEILTNCFTANNKKLASNLPKIQNVDLILAVDGGANHCETCEVTPDIILGDFDSIHPELLKAYQNTGIESISYPTQKDATDLELALNYATERGATNILLLGILGGRWDMSLSNILLTTQKKYNNTNISLAGPDCIFCVLQGGQKMTIKNGIDQSVSFLPIKGTIEGLTLKGFQYELENDLIEFGSSLGISNVIQKDTATVYHSSGILLCIRYFHDGA